MTRRLNARPTQPPRPTTSRRDEVGKTPFYADDADPRDPDVAFFYAEEANHDAEEAIFQELYGTTTTTVPGA